MLTQTICCVCKDRGYVTLDRVVLCVTIRTIRCGWHGGRHERKIFFIGGGVKQSPGG